MNENTHRPLAVDLFAGAGGMSLGFEQAGIDVVAAVEIDPVHAAIHQFNFPDCVVLPCSVTELSGQSIRQAAGIGDRPVQIVCGGAPCQGFSLIGQRVLDDPRNSLVKDFVRIVNELNADYFVFENVKGLTVGKHKKFLMELISLFEQSGYQVRQPWQVLNAVSYGVPQDRQRLFLIGAKEGFTLPDYPLAFTRRPNRGDDLLLTAAPSCYDALGDLPDAEAFEELWHSDVVEDFGAKKSQLISEYASEMRCELAAHWHYGYPRSWNPSQLTSSIRTKHSQISRNRFAETQPGSVEPISRFFKLAPDGVCNTLRAGTDAARGAFTSPRPIHYQHNRCITVREMARLHGFPDWFRFHQTKWHGARQIGNAVPPPLARAVASEVVAAMNYQPSAPTKTLSLGETELLQMDLGQASRYWGIPTPNSKRDRKSGARKRSQEETEQVRLAGHIS